MMKFLLLAAFTLLAGSESIAQQTVAYPAGDPAGSPIETQAILTLPKNALPAARSNLRAVYDALAYLVGRDDVDGKHVGVAGFSYGGQLALHAAAAWAQQAYAKSPEQKFAAHAPFYPVCWAFSAFAQGSRKSPPLPEDAFARWTGAPVKIFAGGKDDYDDRDPGACADFVASLPAAHRPAFSVQLYPEATHGWDQRSATFYENSACKGKGCWNHNDSNADVTRRSIADLVDFFRKTLTAGP
jgi:dienelactone hydrolase